MNNDNHLNEYKEKWQQVKLSDSARARIKGRLEEYTSFHSVRVSDVSRSIEQVPFGAFLQRFNLNRMKTMPIAVLATLLVGAGTTFAAQNSVLGDFLYPVKTEINENVRGAFAVGVNAEAKLQTDLFEERVKEAAKLQAQGRLTGQTAAQVATNLKTQAQVTADAIVKSDAAVAMNTNTQVKAALESFVGLVGLDASLAADIQSTIGTSLSMGTIAIDSYLADVKLRVNALTALMEKYETELDAKVRTELASKLDTAALLVMEAQGKVEADARASLDKATVLIGEVEAKLSTIGQVEVKDGIITDIDLSIDPMKTDIGADAIVGGSGSVGDKDIPQPVPAEDPGASADIDVEVDADSTIDSTVDAQGSLEATSGLGL